MQVNERGTAPITKNIRVIDAQGNEYEATYLRRAKGLVKNGRARFIDEHTLCLACPPNTHLEDKIMNDTLKNTVSSECLDDMAAAAWEQRDNGPRPQVSKEAKETSAEMSLAWVMAKMDTIINDTAHITDTLSALRDMPHTEAHDYAGANKAEAMGKVVQAREETNRQTLRFLEKMYEDLKPRKANPVSMIKEMGAHMDVEEMINMLPPADKVAMMREIMGLA